MIRSFRDRRSHALFHREHAKGFPPDLARAAFIKLRALHRAETLDSLRVPPGNRLEKLRGDRAGLWSIRINDQWRICFDWQEDGPHDVEVVDYHR